MFQLSNYIGGSPNSVRICYAGPTANNQITVWTRDASNTAVTNSFMVFSIP